jgi:hypothetical protein
MKKKPQKTAFSRKSEYFSKKIAEKFGGLKIMRTFATRLRKNGSKTSSLKRLITVQEASTEKYNLSRSVNSFERIISVRTS